MAVYNELGCGFLEKVYQEALAYEFHLQGIPYFREKWLRIPYRDIVLKKRYKVDFLCYDKIILELKAMANFEPNHEAQLINYLKASGMELGLLVNFGKTSLFHKRLIHTKEHNSKPCKITECMQTDYKPYPSSSRRCLK